MLVFVREREGMGRKYETRDIRVHVKTGVRIVCVRVFTASVKVRASVFFCFLFLSR